MDPLLPHYLCGCYKWKSLLPWQIFGCYMWPLYCHTIFVVAIGETLDFHNKCLVARGDLSIATLNIVIAIGGTLCCHDKCLVARGGLSIATINIWLLHLDPLLPCLLLCFYSLESLLLRWLFHWCMRFFATLFFCCYSIYCNPKWLCR
jgi:hypothetical protein